MSVDIVAERRLAFNEGYEQGMGELLATIEHPCLSKDVGAPGSLMRRANDLGCELADLHRLKAIGALTMNKELLEARAALREMSSLLKAQCVKEWRMTSSGRAALAKAES